MGRKRKAPPTSGEHTKFDVSRFTKKSKLEDKVFIVEGKKLYVSKAVLQLASPVFNAMFESDFKEKDMEEIELKEKKFDDMVEFLKLLYPGSREPVSMETVFIVLPLADEFQVDAIKDQCEQCLLQDLEKKRNIRKSSNVKFVYRIQQQGSLYSLHNVEKVCIDILCKKSQKELESAEKVHQLPADSKNKLLVKINKNLEEAVKRLETDIEMKDDIKDMHHYEIADLKQQLEKKGKDLEILKQRFSDLECENRSQGIIKMEFAVNLLTAEGQLSEPKKFRGFDWRCKVSREINLQPRGEEYLGFWACFDPGYPNLENNAIVCFKLLNKNANGSDFNCHMSESTFSKTGRVWGFGNSLKWEDFINPDNGYVVDDMATIEMFVVTFKPRFAQE